MTASFLSTARALPPSSEDQRHMRHALGLAARGLGRTWPNPAVGCVLVNEGVVVGRGWTQPGGRPHAETVALAQAGAAALGATAYVTLEPCAHHGKTPPCVEALIASGVKRVVTALSDPDPRVSGRGHARLKQAGVAVTEGVEAEAAARLQAGFLLRLIEGRPLVTLKLALTLDGRIALADGTSRWITGPEARRRAHRLRAEHDAVLIGAGTARTDDPDLRVRELGTTWQPVRIVVTSQLDLDPESRLARTLADAPLWLLHKEGAKGAEAWRARGAETMAISEGPGGLDPSRILTCLAERGITRLLVEGGGQMAASLLRAGLVDRIVVFSAGHLFGAEGRASIGALSRSTLGAPEFTLLDHHSVGCDLVHVWERVGLIPALLAATNRRAASPRG